MPIDPRLLRNPSSSDPKLDEEFQVIIDRRPDVVSAGAGVRLIRVSALAKELGVSSQDAHEWLIDLHVPCLPLRRRDNESHDLYFNLWYFEFVLHCLSTNRPHPDTLDDDRVHKLKDNLGKVAAIYARSSTKATRERLGQIALKIKRQEQYERARRQTQITGRKPKPPAGKRKRPNGPKDR